MGGVEKTRRESTSLGISLLLLRASENSEREMAECAALWVLKGVCILHGRLGSVQLRKAELANQLDSLITFDAGRRMHGYLFGFPTTGRNRQSQQEASR